MGREVSAMGCVPAAQPSAEVCGVGVVGALRSWAIASVCEILGGEDEGLPPPGVRRP